MANSAELIAIAERHVREGEAHVANQRAIAARLERDGHRVAADMARQVLATLEHSLDLARMHLETERAAHKR
jgi:hypothetical protein